MVGKGLCESPEAPIGINVIDHDRTTRPQGCPSEINFEANVVFAMQATVNETAPHGVVRVYPGACARLQLDRLRQQLRPQLGTLKNTVDLSQTFALAPPMQRLGRTAPRKLGRRNMRAKHAGVCSIKGYSAPRARTGKSSRRSEV